MTGSDIVDPRPRTLASYEAAADRYVSATGSRPAPVAAHLAAFAGLLPPGGSVLEIGSGPGDDADALAALGFQVRRTDATGAFVERFRALGHRADLLDVTTDPLGGPYDGVWANAVLLHLTETQLADALVKLRAALAPGGTFGFSMKAGTGCAWSDAKLGLPRFFCYWQQDALCELLVRTGWRVLAVEEFTGRQDDWLLLRCRPEPGHGSRR